MQQSSSLGIYDQFEFKTPCTKRILGVDVSKNGLKD